MGKTYRVGDHIIDFVCIYKIISISQDADGGGRLIHSRPIEGTEKVFTDTTPEKNFAKSGLRHLLVPKEIDQLLRRLKDPIGDYTFDARLVKDDIYTNDPTRTIKHLKYLSGRGDLLTKAETELKEEMLNHLCLEISFVTGKSIPSIQKTITTNLSTK